MSLYVPEYSLLALIAAFLAGFVLGRVTGAAAPHRSRERSSRPISASPISDGATTADVVALLPAETRIEIETLVADGRKIEAIRVCRAALGLGLKEAKDAVEHIESDIGRGARA